MSVPLPGQVPATTRRSIQCKANPGNVLQKIGTLAACVPCDARAPFRSFLVHRTTLAAAILVSAGLTVSAGPLAAQQSDLSVSPFVAFLPSAGTNPMAGLALSLAGSGGLG